MSIQNSSFNNFNGKDKMDKSLNYAGGCCSTSCSTSCSCTSASIVK